MERQVGQRSIRHVAVCSGQAGMAGLGQFVFGAVWLGKAGMFPQGTVRPVMVRFSSVK